ncbi:hypothetical protein JXA85_06695 [Candidatus Woesearchaeota archaeon]|nr:hypothetical protein [Candidatus Woesearchaeota archaeon]
MKKIFIMSIAFLFIISGCKNVIDEKQNDVDFDTFYCEKDLDCTISQYDVFRCCESPCVVFAYNLTTLNWMEDWRSKNCNFENESDFNKDKWINCPQSPHFEFIECRVEAIRNAKAKCLNNSCEVIYG